MGISRFSPPAWRLLALGATLIAAALTIVNCSGALPRSEKTMRSPWKSFDEAKAAYDKILPNHTTVEELKALGYDPYTTPNIHILTYLDVIERFIPNEAIHVEDLDPGVRECIQARNECMAYEATPGKTKRKRTGNVMLDMLGFKRKTHETGWSFEALVLLKNGRVVYKLWGGTPVIDERNERKKPLGPLQDAGDLARDLVEP